MPRSVRIEYPGALYHVMARGNRRQEIFLSDSDREMFLATLGQACERAGWEVLAFVLMSNHYHIALRTPEPNLVAGMTWFQNTYTRRFNARHQLWGRLFGDRYKAIPVESDGLLKAPIANRGADYLTVLLDYLHLNPVRARLIEPEKSQSIFDYPWSSVARGYARPPSKRERWLEVETGLALIQCRDDSRGRRRYVERLDRRAAAEEAERCGLSEPEIEKAAEQASASPRRGLRRGWYWGSDAFRESLLKRAGKLPAKNATYRSSALGRDHAEQAAESIVERAERHFGLAKGESIAEFAGRGDLRRVSAAWAIWKTTSVPQGWIAERLNLRSAPNVSQQVRRFDRMEKRALPKEVRMWRDKVSRFFD